MAKAHRIIPPISDKYILRFWSQVAIHLNDANACWVWKGALTGRGYGTMSIFGKHIHSNRLAFAISNCSDPGPMMVCHSCDNPACCNPRHLFLGTNRDNIVDMVKKGRANRPYGSRHHKAKLTEKDVLMIREQWGGEISKPYDRGKKTLKQIAKEFGVSFRSIHLIVRRKIWTNI